MIKDISRRNERVKPSDRETAVLQANFPGCFDREGNFDLAKFQELLKDKVSVKREGYGLNFLGRNYARMLASLDSTTVVVPDEDHNAKAENKDSENIYITGDNLDALKQLLHSYAAKVKCIYIDPPYNTGSDGFVYNDKFEFTKESLAEKLSIEVDEAERILHLTKRGSASHSAWLMFMYPRLMLARDMLRDDGVIFISIDDNEQANLKLLCDDVFGEQNFVGQIIIKTATDNNPTQINTEHEYMLCYVNKKDFQDDWGRKSAAAQRLQEKYEEIKAKENDLNKIEAELKKWIKNNKEILPQVEHYNLVDSKGVYSKSSNSSNPHPGGYMFDIVHPVTNRPCSKPANGWRWTKETFDNYVKNGDVWWGEDETVQPHIKMRLLDAKEQLKSVIYEDNRGETQMLSDLFGGKKVFDNPKPHNVLARLIDFVSCKDSIILDFFSGSATTAHAVMQLNAEDGGRRKYIMVQLAEPVKIGSEAEKAGYKTIDEIGRKRIELAAAKIKAEHPNTQADLGYRHFTLQEPSEETLDKLEKFVPMEEDGLENMLSNDIFHAFGLQTVLATWLLRDGYGLNAKPEVLDFAGYKGYYIGRHLYLIEEGLTEDGVVAIVEKYDNDKDFVADNLVVFGYNFTWTKLAALRDNLAKLKDTEKNMRVMFDVRY